MNNSCAAIRGIPPGWSRRRIFAAVLAVSLVSLSTCAQAEDGIALRPLPPVFQFQPGAFVPVTARPMSAEAPSQVIFPEQAGSQSQSHLAPAGPPLRLVNREEPVTNGPANYELLRFVEPAEPPQPPEAPSPDQGLSPFGDESKPPEEPAPLEGSAEENKPAEKKAEQAGGEPQKYGREPVNYSLQFLREQDVLLNPGDWQFDTGFAYTLFDDDFPVALFNPLGEIVDVDQARIRDRLIYTPLAVRYGWSDNVQLFAALPTGFATTQISRVGESVSFEKGGIGDLTAGGQFHLLAGEDTLPDLVGSLALTAPSGDFNAPVGSVVPGSALGQGFWAISAQLLFINRYDPIIAFYGVGYRHLFEREFSGLLFSPGEQFSYQFGVGFAANDRVTLSASFFGFFISETLIDGEALLGTNVEPLSLRFAATIARNERIIEPFVQVGMTDFAPAASFGVTITFYNHDRSDGDCRRPCFAFWK